MKQQIQSTEEDAYYGWCGNWHYCCKLGSFSIPTSKLICYPYSALTFPYVKSRVLIFVSTFWPYLEKSFFRPRLRKHLLCQFRVQVICRHCILWSLLQKDGKQIKLRGRDNHCHHIKYSKQRESAKDIQLA